jgi:hypothetical protein
MFTTHTLLSDKIKSYKQHLRFVRFQVLTAASMSLVMEAVRTTETSVNFNVTTWRYIPEHSKLQHLRFPPNPSNQFREI